MKIDIKGIGKRIKNRRKELGISLDKMAELTGYKSRTSICKIETGKDYITLPKIEKFADVLYLDISYLLGIDNKSKNNNNISEKKENISYINILRFLKKLNDKDIKKAEKLLKLTFNIFKE